MKLLTRARARLRPWLTQLARMLCDHVQGGSSVDVQVSLRQLNKR